MKDLMKKNDNGELVRIDHSNTYEGTATLADGEVIKTKFRCSNRQEAIEQWEAWNSRAERTCEVVKGKCSNCGKDLPEDPYSDYEGNYCPNCGARVVGE